MYKYPEIKQYIQREGKVPFYNVPEYHELYCKYDDDDDTRYTLHHEISEIFEEIYYARTEAHERNVEYYINRAYKIAQSIGLKLTDFGLSNKEGLYLLYLGYNASLEFYNNVREVILSSGLMYFSDSYMTSLLDEVERKIKYFEQEESFASAALFKRD